MPKENNKNTTEEIKVEDPKKKKPLKKGFISGTGRRKTATASVFLWQSKGDFIVNDKPIKEYFPSEVDQLEWVRPFHSVGIAHPEAKFSASIKVAGSGKTGQLGAVMHGISRALAKISEENQIALRKDGLLTRDSRMVERKKYFLHKARKRPQYSKR
ncbi:30S ribosomal protein S9 [Patescibacteria group bacterium]|nr:30S ribosomal protein S9 [Patescibacteria group bacterium]